MDFGVGIHGEPGIERRPFNGLDDTVDQMFTTLIEHGNYQRPLRSWDIERSDWREETQYKQALRRGEKVIAVVNNLGGTPLSELYGVYLRLAHCCAGAGIEIVRNFVGSWCTSLDMYGVSITLMRADEETLALWDAPVNTPALRWNC